MTLTFKNDLDSVKVNHYAKLSRLKVTYSFHSKVIVQTHTGPTTLPVPLVWLVKQVKLGPKESPMRNIRHLMKQYVLQAKHPSQCPTNTVRALKALVKI